MGQHMPVVLSESIFSVYSKVLLIFRVVSTTTLALNPVTLRGYKLFSSKKSILSRGAWRGGNTRGIISGIILRGHS